MMDVSTLALNMTFLMTLGIGLLMFLTHVLFLTIMLMLAGASRLAVLTFTAIWKRMMPHGKALPRETPSRLRVSRLLWQRDVDQVPVMADRYPTPLQKF
jgi:hypothetical protein